MFPLAEGLGRKLLDVAGRHEGRLALSARGEALTYGTLIERAASVARTLLEVGAGEPGARVAILSDRTCDAYVGIVAALLAGAAYVPLNPRFPIERNRKILERSGAIALIVDAANAGTLPGLLAGRAQPIPVVAARTEVLRHAPLGIRVPSPAGGSSDLQGLGPARRPDDLAYLMFTSGSTGVPKGVPISLRNLEAYLRNATALAEVEEHDRLIQLVDLTFDLSVHDMFVSWTNGAAVFSVPENAALMATRFVEEHELTGWLSVPSTAGLLKQEGLLKPNTLRSLRFTLFCGEPLTGAVAEAWCLAAPAAKVFNVYGPTEATVAFSAYQYRPTGSAPPAVVPLGQPFPDQSMALFGVDNVPTPHGEIGEICLSGSQVMSGYWNDPELTKERFFLNKGQRWYRTGDLGRYAAESGFLFAGRVDRQVKIKGFRVELKEIEHTLREVTGRDLVAVVPWPATPDSGATSCVGFVTGEPTDIEPILDGCRSRLPDYMIPSRIIFVEQLPFNANGKVDYRQLAMHPALTVATG